MFNLGYLDHFSEQTDSTVQGEHKAKGGLPASTSFIKAVCTFAYFLLLKWQHNTHFISCICLL